MMMVMGHVLDSFSLKLNKLALKRSLSRISAKTPSIYIMIINFLEMVIDH